MRIKMAHLQVQGIDFAVFDADASSRSRRDREALLARLTGIAQQQGLRVEKAALAYENCGRVEFFGTPDLVEFLANNGVSQWTHEIEA